MTSITYTHSILVLQIAGGIKIVGTFIERAGKYLREKNFDVYIPLPQVAGFDQFDTKIFELK